MDRTTFLTARFFPLTERTTFVKVDFLSCRILKKKNNILLVIIIPFLKNEAYIKKIPLWFFSSTLFVRVADSDPYFKGSEPDPVLIFSKIELFLQYLTTRVKTVNKY